MPQRADESFEEYRLRQQTKEGEAEMTFTLPYDYIPGEWIKVRLVCNDGPLLQVEKL